MVLIYLTAANASKISCRGTVVGVEIVKNYTTTRSVLLLKEQTKPEAKLATLIKALETLSGTDEKITVFVDDERLAEEYSHAQQGEWEALRYPRLWKETISAMRRCRWPVTVKNTARLSGYLYRELCKSLNKTAAELQNKTPHIIKEERPNAAGT